MSRDTIYISQRKPAQKYNVFQMTAYLQFQEWLKSEMQQRGWSIAELGRRTHLSAASISNVLNGMRNPGPDFCRAIARALGYPQEYVFRKAGLIDDPPLSSYAAALADRPIDHITDQIIQILVKLTPEERREILALLQVHLKHRQKGK